MKTYAPPLGSGVDQVLKAMVQAADATGEQVSARFNGETLTANPGDDFVVLAAKWWTAAEAAHEAWKRRIAAQAREIGPHTPIGPGLMPKPTPPPMTDEELQRMIDAAQEAELVARGIADSAAQDVAR